MTKVLVAHYSRTGHTRSVARQIAKTCAADEIIIEDARVEGGRSGYARSALEAALHLDAPIRPVQRKPGDYDVVVVGTPIWSWNVACPVRSFIEEYRHQFRRVAVFCTHGGSGHEKVLYDLQCLCGMPVLAALALNATDVKNQRCHTRLNRFATAVKTSRRLRRKSDHLGVARENLERRP